MKLVLMFLAEKVERDAERRQKKKALRSDMTAAVKTRDPSEITKAFNRINRT